MNLAYLKTPEISFFSDATDQFSNIISHLKSDECKYKEHADIEKYIQHEGFELLRHLFQGYLAKLASNEVVQSAIISPEGKRLSYVKKNTSRQLMTLFGEVTVMRTSYAKPKGKSVFPIDKVLNLASRKFSDGVAQRVATEASKNSFDDTVESIKTTTGATIAKQQSLQLVQDVAVDFDNFYLQNRYLEPEDNQGILVLQFDGKGVVVRPDSLRECTAKAAKRSKKLNSRLSQGEKKDRKRMAQVATVYSALPDIRTPSSIMNNEKNIVTRLPYLKRNKRVWASIKNSAEFVIEDAFKEALQRDPEQKREWVVLIDGHPHQLKLIERVMKSLRVKATIIMDFIHVLEYLWKAGWCFFEKGDPKIEKWIAKNALKILNGNCSEVAKGIKIKATKNKIEKRDAVDLCAKYLVNNKSRFCYNVALEKGFPIASGVIEGACRHIINDRLDITGARWSLEGAEAILRLRSLRSSNDFDKYWNFYKKQEQKRNYG
ncbi:MAG: ISKra4 family transposase [Psychromonas sp.]|nr:ISKra4 family transposase [Psychromonas sp.]